MTPNDLAAEIYLALVRERIKARGLDKIKDPDMKGAAQRACALSDIFWTALGEYALAKGVPGPVQEGPVPPPGPVPAPVTNERPPPAETPVAIPNV